MINEITVKIGDKNRKVFLQNGFYLNSTPTNRIHRHNYTEVHLVSSKNSVFTVENVKYEIQNESMIVIPGGSLHAFIAEVKPTLHTAFQIDFDIKKVSLYKINSDMLSNFFYEINRALQFGDYTGVSAYISLLARHFCAEEKTSAHTITDYGFIINEFFSNHYSENIHLEDLAKELYLSERQSERLVIEYTGKTFKEALTATRIDMAKYLIEYYNMPLSDAAEYVGYNSYSGFWKAMKRHNQS